MPLRKYAESLEALYRRYNRREFVSPDPLEFLYLYENPHDREVVALVASSLAYGRVGQILKSVRRVLDVLGPEPARRVQSISHRKLSGELAGFKHRFADGQNVVGLLMATQAVLRQYKTIERFFVSAAGLDDETVLPAMSAFVKLMRAKAPSPCGHLLCDPSDGSACKRLNLMLRWLVRLDGVDVGDWREIPPARLIVPLDTHMHRIGLISGAIDRKSADARSAMEFTKAFAAVCPQDPVRYDFSLTRPGIRGEGPLPEFLQQGGVHRYNVAQADTKARKPNKG
jgi:uncharacterized protein (TIGR02757 family)